MRAQDINCDNIIDHDKLHQDASLIVVIGKLGGLLMGKATSTGCIMPARSARTGIASSNINSSEAIERCLMVWSRCCRVNGNPIGRRKRYGALS